MLVSNIDDAFIDIYYIIYKIRRKLFIYSRHKPFRAADLMIKKEQNFALMIPAWQEADVIRAMLSNSLSSYIYGRYHIFIGCYSNDPDTVREVKKSLPHHKNLHICHLNKPGPTSKADCLNKIYADIRSFENNKKIRFAAYILHDAEDIIHPLELKLYNLLIPRKDMVQIPVIPLERPWYDLTGGHYQDEFAENHIKELVVRESLTGHVPSAGVGTALSRRAMTIISNHHNTAPFDIGNLTEDYDLALRLNSYGLKLIFARFKARKGDIIATREYFPNTVRAVIRQKSRWLMGIAFQGWRNQKWQGPLPLKYALYRDRKSIFTAQLAMAAYFILLNILLVWLIEWLFPAGYRYPPLVRKGEFLEYMLWANLFFLISRALHRLYFTGQIYGTIAAIMSLPRQLWGNVLNCLASIRAIYLYSEHLLLNTALIWEKTDHSFPGREQLGPYHKRLGEMLIDRKWITSEKLKEILLLQGNNSIRLGQLVMDKGYITEQQLSEILLLQGGSHDGPR